MENTNIESEFVQIGEGTIIEPSAKIVGLNGKAKRIVIGDNCYIGKNVLIMVDEFSLGDYSKIHHDTNIHGYNPCFIGHNAWIGQFTIIDSVGGVNIGNNCGIGAHSQLWSHIKYGDTLEGCRFHSTKKMVVEDDVWFVGHCIVSPIHAKSKSMAMVGSVVTKDMDYNTIYAGSPAKNISNKIGGQFDNISVEEKFERMKELLKLFSPSNFNIRIVKDIREISKDDEITYFNVSDRKYTKKRNAEEVQFMKFLLPERAKFTPYE